MRMVTNKIFTGKSKTLDSLIKEAGAKNQIKTASVKTAEENKTDKEGEMHVKMQPGDPCCGTDTGEIIEGDEKIKASAPSEVKVAEKDEAEGVKHATDPVGGTNTCKDEDKVYDKKANAADKAKVASQNKKAEETTAVNDKKDYSAIPNSGGRTHAPDECCGAPNASGKDGSEEKNKEASSASKQVKKGIDAIDWSKLVAVANLKPVHKNKLFEYWRNLYPAEFAEAMTQDR